jgi:hypothetical protein
MRFSRLAREFSGKILPGAIEFPDAAGKLFSFPAQLYGKYL